MPVAETAWRSNGSNVIGQTVLKLVGFFLLLTGWLLVMFALVLLPATTGRTVFVCVGLLIDLLGFGLAVRSHMPLKEERG